MDTKIAIVLIAASAKLRAKMEMVSTMSAGKKAFVALVATLAGFGIMYMTTAVWHASALAAVLIGLAIGVIIGLVLGILLRLR